MSIKLNRKWHKLHFPIHRFCSELMQLVAYFVVQISFLFSWCLSVYKSKNKQFIYIKKTKAGDIITIFCFCPQNSKIDRSNCCCCCFNFDYSFFKHYNKQKVSYWICACMYVIWICARVVRWSFFIGEMKVYIQSAIANNSKQTNKQMKKLKQKQQLQQQ